MPVRAAEAISKAVMMMRVLPLLLNESKKPGPAWMPMVNMKRTRPKLPKSFGINTPKWPKSKAMKITADTSSDTPLILILPNMKPKATMVKRAKYDDFSRSNSIVSVNLYYFSPKIRINA